MKKSKTPPPFSDEMQFLTDTYELAIMKANSEGQLRRSGRSYKHKIRLIKQCSKHYALIKKMKLYEDESILQLISAAVTAFVNAESSDLERINKLYEMKLKVKVDLSK